MLKIILSQIVIEISQYVENYKRYSVFTIKLTLFKIIKGSILLYPVTGNPESYDLQTSQVESRIENI